MTSSNDTPRFNRHAPDGLAFKPLECAAVCLFLITAVTLAALYFYRHGYLLYYGDAQAHLNIARSLFDSRTPGYDQLGTVWLPLLHLICLPFAHSNTLWSTGLAGTIPVATCFVVAGLCLYYSAIDSYQSRASALVVLLCFALNPNILYLASIPMTEVVFIAGLSILLLSVLRFHNTQHVAYLLTGIAASWMMSLTRYDGWFLIPFASFAFGYTSPRRFVLFGAVAALAPAYWMAHNWWETGNALDFYNGPYSAFAIQGNKSYPGYQDWLTAIRYYFEAAKLCCGSPLIILGTLGLVSAVYRRKFLAATLLLLTPLFYIWSMHSSKGSPIFVPSLWPHGYYNTRYGIAVEVAASFAAGALVTARARLILPLLIAAIAISPWLLHPTTDNWICWKESQRNSDSRRAWTIQAAAFLDNNYKTGEGILTEFGDLCGIYGVAGINLKQTLHEGNGPAYFANTAHHGFVRQAQWAIAQAGDKLASAISANDSFEMIQTVQVPGAPALNIYKRKHMRGPI